MQQRTPQCCWCWLCCCAPLPQVAFKPLLGGEASKPQQAMLMAASKAHPGLAAYAVAKAKKDGSHVATLNTAAVEKQLGSLVGGRQRPTGCVL